MIEKLQIIIGQMVTQIAQLQHELEVLRGEIEMNNKVGMSDHQMQKHMHDDPAFAEYVKKQAAQTIEMAA